MKLNRTIKYVVALLAIFLCVSCTESNTPDEQEDEKPSVEVPSPDDDDDDEVVEPTPTTSDVANFSVWCGSVEYEATISKSTRVINIDGVPNTDEITKIDCGCDEGVVISPKLEEFIKKWKPSNKFTVRSDTETLSYTIKITQERTPQIVDFDIVIDSEKYIAVIDQAAKTIHVDCGSASFKNVSGVNWLTSKGTKFSDATLAILNGKFGLTNTLELSLGILSCEYTLTLTEPVSKPVVGDIQFKVNPNDRYQQIDFMGGDIERSQSFMQKSSDPQAVADLCFKDVNFSVCRVAYDKNQEMTAGDKNFGFYTNAIKSMQDIRKSYPHVEFWATMRSDYDGYGDDSNLPDWICSYPSSSSYFWKGKYAAFLVDYLELMHDNGVTISYLSTAKEWSSFVSAERAVEIIEKLQAECDQRNIPMPKIVDPAGWSLKASISFVNKVVSLGKTDLFYGFATHDYWSGDSRTFADFTEATKKTGKPAYEDEMNCGSSGPTSGEESKTFDKILIAYKSRFDIYEAGFTGELFFEPFSRGQNKETRSIYFRSGEAPKKMRAYYVLKEWVNSIVEKNSNGENLKVGFNPKNKYRVNSQIVKSNMGKIRVIAFANDEAMVFWLMNDNNSESLKNMTLEVEGVKGFASSVNMRRFDLSSDKTGVWSEGLKCVGNTISLDDVPSESLSVVYVPLK